MHSQKGFTLIEVILAMILLACAVLGVMGSFQWADRAAKSGVHGERALALVQARLEAKRAGSWQQLLQDDLDFDGMPEIAMRDDGADPDAAAGDGIYTASLEDSGIRLVWTVQPDRPGSLLNAGSVLIQAEATYPNGPGRTRTIRLGTLRANPQYLGIR
jgi:prepilin-type N-terminal cleavage/methylation domain-containing protein